MAAAVAGVQGVFIGWPHCLITAAGFCCVKRLRLFTINAPFKPIRLYNWHRPHVPETFVLPYKTSAAPHGYQRCLESIVRPRRCGLLKHRTNRRTGPLRLLPDLPMLGYCKMDITDWTQRSDYITVNAGSTCLFFLGRVAPGPQQRLYANGRQGTARSSVPLMDTGHDPHTNTAAAWFRQKRGIVLKGGELDVRMSNNSGYT